MLGKEAAEEKGWNGLERARPPVRKWVCRGVSGGERRADSRRGASGQPVAKKCLLSPNPAKAALPGPGCVLSPTLHLDN